jgi:hypothetical protein
MGQPWRRYHGTVRDMIWLTFDELKPWTSARLAMAAGIADHVWDAERLDWSLTMHPAQIKAEQQILHFALLQAIRKFEEKTGMKVTKVDYKPIVSEVTTTFE